jgi:AcrR family transcriptional regulator
MPDTEERPLRADAQRNRDRLLEVAAIAFARDGADATLNGIARAAGVGIGTLFRHFATREELVEATYRSALAKLCEAAPELALTRPAEDALREWMHAFVEYMTTKHGMADTLRAAVAAGLNTRLKTLDRLTEAVAILLHAGIEQGVMRADLDPADVLASLGGITLIAGERSQRAQAGRLIQLLLDGLRAQPAAG